MAQWGGWVSQIFPIEHQDLATFFTETNSLNPGWCERFGSYDLIVSYCYDPEGVFHKRLQEVSPATLLRGRHRPDEKASMHATKVLLSPLVHVGIENPDPEPHLTVPNGVHINPGPGCWLATHPGSGSTQKNWPIECWDSLLRMVLDSTKWNILVLGGEPDLQRIETLRLGLPKQRIVYVVNEPLANVAAYLKQCHFYLGHDSGISHFAAALGLEGIVLWGPSNREVWHPLSKRFNVIEHPDGLMQLPAAQIFKTLSEKIEHFSR